MEDRIRLAEGNRVVSALQKLLKLQKEIGIESYAKLTNAIKQINEARQGREGQELIAKIEKEIDEIANSPASERKGKAERLAAKYTDIAEKTKDKGKNLNSQTEQYQQLSTREKEFLRLLEEVKEKTKEAEKAAEKQKALKREEYSQDMYENIPGYSSVSAWCEKGFGFLDIPAEGRAMALGDAANADISSYLSDPEMGANTLGQEKWKEQNIPGYSEIERWTQERQAEQQRIQEQQQYEQIYEQYREEIEKAAERRDRMQLAAIGAIGITITASLENQDKLQITYPDKDKNRQTREMDKNDVSLLSPDNFDGQSVGMIKYNDTNGKEHWFDTQHMDRPFNDDLMRMADLGMTGRLEAEAVDLSRQYKQEREKVFNYEHEFDFTQRSRY